MFWINQRPNFTHPLTFWSTLSLNLNPNPHISLPINAYLHPSSIFTTLSLSCLHTLFFLLKMTLPVKFVYFFLSSLAVILFNNGAQASHRVYTDSLQSSAAVNVKSLHRTGYHFQPLRNWINGNINVRLFPSHSPLIWFYYRVILYM